MTSKNISLLFLVLVGIHTSFAQTSVKKGKLITENLNSSVLKENKTGIDLNRRIKIYLPAGYETSGKSYPVVYFLHNFFWDNDRMFEDGRIVALLDRAFTTGATKEFILVVPDYRTATTGSIYENSPVSGRWLDHTTQEVIPFIDKKFRTLPRKESRAIMGEFMGGRGALKMAMTYPDLFNAVYALHPVATGMGELPWAYTAIDWKKIYATTAYPNQDLQGITQIFVTVSQAFLPNLNRTPLYCDYFMEPVQGQPTVHSANMEKAKKGFLLDEQLSEYADNLRKVKGIAMDWGRFDPTYAHVDSNREFSRKLEDYAIEHEAEEYRGSPYDKTWLDDGRFYSRVLPFLNKHLSFQ